eukprot:570138-Rhodomonas_salina.4
MMWCDDFAGCVVMMVMRKDDDGCTVRASWYLFCCTDRYCAGVPGGQAKRLRAGARRRYALQTPPRTKPSVPRCAILIWYCFGTGWFGTSTLHSTHAALHLVHLFLYSCGTMPLLHRPRQF